jgi:hypothetical protein
MTVETMIIDNGRKSKLGELEDILRGVFREVLQHHHPFLKAKFDKILEQAEVWCKSKNRDDFDKLEATLEELKPDEAILVRPTRSHCP